MNPQEAFDIAWNRSDLLLKDIAVARFGNTTRTCNDLDELAKAVRRFHRESAENPTINTERYHMMQTEFITPEITAQIRERVQAGQVVRLNTGRHGGYWEVSCKGGNAEVLARTPGYSGCVRGDNLKISMTENVYTMVVKQGSKTVGDFLFDETEIGSIEAEDGWLLKGASS